MKPLTDQAICHSVGLAELRTKDFMRMPLTILSGFLSFTVVYCVSCSSNKAWPPPHAEVRAFLYNLDGEGGLPCVTNGHLDSSVVDTNGVRLTERQVARFLAAVTGKHSDHNVMGCYVPHHAYVFYNQKHRITGWVELCFGCYNYRASSPNAPRWFDIYDLRDLSIDLGLPVLKNEDDYLTLKKKDIR